MGEQMQELASGEAAGRSGDTPRTYLVWSLVSTALLFLPLGLIALFFSLRTNSMIKRGELDRARAASKSAFVLDTIATVVGGLSYILLVGALLALGAFGGA